MKSLCPEDRIPELSPERDFEEIARLLTTCAFAWDIERALEFALFRTYAIPSISGLLDRTGEFGRRAEKRYDDTELLLSEPLENGLDSPRGRAAIGRINEMHGCYRISNEDMLYVLGTFVLEPVRWLERFGRRGMTTPERQAWTNYYRGLGARMGIAGIPADFEAFAAINADYERRYMRFASSNRAVGVATLDLLLGFYLPRPLFRLGRPLALSLMDAPLLEAMGFAPPPGWLRRGVLGAMRLRARILLLLPRRRRPRLVTARFRRGYPQGYEIAELGTWPKAGGCAGHRQAEDVRPQPEC
ncbi:MAG: oxygenase MpaB family protein [Limimaricola soesokkakensis]|uniref:oxygenase MpaB family protein n=1 Tax=Limimaricola soesokkakensis TaxID=1343159 RepID=UPI0040592B6E